MENNHQLIITIINKGCAKIVMDAARNAGATGGTVLNGLGTANQLEEFIGLNIPNEKEIVLIVVDNDNLGKILSAIKTHAGRESKAQGITFSLPVGDFAMLSDMFKE